MVFVRMNHGPFEIRWRNKEINPAEVPKRDQWARALVTRVLTTAFPDVVRAGPIGKEWDYNELFNRFIGQLSFGSQANPLATPNGRGVAVDYSPLFLHRLMDLTSKNGPLNSVCCEAGF